MANNVIIKRTDNNNTEVYLTEQLTFNANKNLAYPFFLECIGKYFYIRSVSDNRFLSISNTIITLKYNVDDTVKFIILNSFKGTKLHKNSYILRTKKHVLKYNTDYTPLTDDIPDLLQKELVVDLFNNIQYNTLSKYIFRFEKSKDLSDTNLLSKSKLHKYANWITVILIFLVLMLLYKMV